MEKYELIVVLFSLLLICNAFTCSIYNNKENRCKEKCMPFGYNGWVYEGFLYNGETQCVCSTPDSSLEVKTLEPKKGFD